jgi:hypothetical protein
MLAFVCGVALCVQSVRAQVTLTGTNYTQNFNTISNGLPAGWSVRTNATAISLGTAANFPTVGKTWADTTGEFGNCASTFANSGTNFIGSESTTMQGNCTNRALAIRQTAAFGDPKAAFVFQIANTVGLSNLTFNVDLSILKSNAYSTTWTIDYAVSNSPSSFTVLDTFPDPGAFGTTTKTCNLGADANDQTNSVWIRVVALSAAIGSSGSRDTFSIDNFTLSYAGPPVSPIPLYIQLADTNVVLTWSDSSFALQAATVATGTYTNVIGATSPFTNTIDSSAKFYRLIH